jgi:F-type H+-transporting ATPase subunit alpha
LNGYLDDVPVDQASDFARGLQEYLGNNKAKYGEIIASEKKLTDEAESLLKEGITEFKQSFTAAA